MSGPYWNEELETMPWAAVEAWQDRQLAGALHSIVRRSSFYRERVEHEQLDALRSDPRRGLAALPFTGKDELRASQEERVPGQPLGRQQAVPLDEIIQFVSSSGTTGVPLYYGLTRADVNTWADVCANTFFTAGVRSDDVVGHLVGLPMVAGGLAYADGYRRIGATLAWLGGFPTERILGALPRLQVSALMATTSFGMYLTESAANGSGPDPQTLGIRKLQLGGEPGLSNPEIRARIKQGWGTSHVREGMGLADVLAAMWSECEFEGGMHYNGQSAVVLELVDPDTLAPVPWSDGGSGEIVYTTFKREATPVIRYRSSDRVVVTAMGCHCGRTSPRIQVVGRTDDMLIYKGMNVFPTAVRDVVLRSGGSGVAPYIRIWKDTAQQVRFDSPIPVDVELESDDMPGNQRAALVTAIESAVREHLQARVAVTLVAPRTLPRSTHKSAIVAVRDEAVEGPAKASKP